MFALVLVALFVIGLISACVGLARSSAKQQRQRQGPADMRRADEQARQPAYDNKKAYRAAQDASNWWNNT